MTQFFAVFATDKPGQLEVRERIRPAHRQYLRNPAPHPVVVRLGGPTLDQFDGDMNGTLLVIQAASIEDVQAFLADDPYSQAQIFERVEVRPWNWGLGKPEGMV